MRCNTIALCLVFCFTTVNVTCAQKTWNGPIGGRWLDFGNWTGNTPPDANDDVLIQAFNSPVVADGPGSQVTRDLTLVDGASIEIVGGNLSGVSVFGDTLSNDGQIQINSNDSAQGATLNVAGGATVDAVVSGEIVLWEQGRLSSQPNTDAVTHGANHTIRGEGILDARFTNNGIITAADIDLDGNAELLIGTGAGGGGPEGLTRTNNNIIQSSSSSDLRMNLHLIQAAAGQIIADSGMVSLTNSRIQGGKLTAINGGVFESIDGLLRLEGVHLTSGSTLRKFNMNTGSTLNIENGTFTNDGTVQIGIDATEATVLNFATSETIDGSGEIILLTENLGGVGSRIRAEVGIVGTFGTAQTVRGVGAIEAAFVNNGTIVAEPRIGSILQLETATKPKTNNGTLRADAGATLRIRATTVVQDNNQGQILANGGTVELNGGGTVVGGRLEASGAGFFTVNSSGRLTDVTNNAPLEVQNGNHSLLADGASLVNNNTITNKNQIRVQSNLALSGSGEILLPDVGVGSNLSVDAGFTLTQDAGHAIRGVGQINGPGTFINNGLVEGTSAAQPLEINARIGGSGVLRDVRIDGVHAPSDVGATAVAALEGSYEISNFGTLDIEIGGTTAGSEHDQLSSTGTVTLAAASVLDVSLIDLSNGYTPTAGDTFDIITASAHDIMGTFNNNEVNLPEFGLGYALTWQPVDYSDPRKVTLELLSATPYDVDLDDDNDVDGNDFLLIQRGGDHSLIAPWEFEFGSGVGTLATSRAIPEPRTSMILSTIAVCLAATRRTSSASP